jgi:two-component system OmpR family sensor kinase
MRKESILFKLNILFALALMATLVAGFLVFLHTIKTEHMDLFFKSRLIVKEMRILEKVPVDLIEEFNFRQIKGTEKRKILQHATQRGGRSLPREMQQRFNNFKKHRKILTYKGHSYVYLKSRGIKILLEDKKSIWECCLEPVLVFLGMLILLIIMYVLLRKSLMPLKRLEKEIVKYGEGKKLEVKYLGKKDEVSLASNAFYASVEKVEELRNSRQLFIRNIFHELNTPVTKGKILAELVDEPKTQNMLNSIFTRLSSLLRELAQMEKITSHSFSIDIKPVRVKELIDEASDLLYLDDPIVSNVTDEMMEVDFSSMSIVFKNLIDNAVKYGANLSIDYVENNIIFSSDGEPLDKALSHYTQAFSKGENVPTDKGFGLGLYIVNEILSKHKMGFLHSYNDGKNAFTINLKNIL